MKKQYNVLLIPAGSGMAIAAINAFKQDEGMRIICADSDRLAAGLYLSNKGYVIPTFDDSRFHETIEGIVKKEEIDVIIPALDTILLDFSKRKKEFERLNVKVLVSEPETVAITRDKWRTYEKLRGVINLPRSFLKPGDVDIKFPLIVKPRGGSGSEDVHKVTSEEELRFFYERVSDPIIQEYLEGTEYTVDCLTDNEGNLLFCIPRERIETKAGISTKGRIVEVNGLDSIADKISSSMDFRGPFFFQAKEDGKGIPKLTEINPRISGTMSLSSFSGPNIHSMAVRMIMGEKLEIPRVNYGLYMTRYWEDIYLTEEELID